MKKYYYLFKNSIQEATAYRFHTFAVLFSEIFIFMFFFYLWKSIYQNGGTIGNYDQKTLISYYLISMLLTVVAKNYGVGWYVAEEIKSGDLNKTLVKPVNFFYSMIAYNLGKVIYNIAIYLIIFGLLSFYIHNHLIIPKDLYLWIVFIYMVIMGSIIYFLLSYLAGLGAFWLGYVVGINFSFQIMITFFDGSFIPLDLFPRGLKIFSEYLPFQYIVYIPTSIFNSRIAPEPKIIIVPIIWITILYLITKFLFNRGLKKYEGYGN